MSARAELLRLKPLLKCMAHAPNSAPDTAAREEPVDIVSAEGNRGETPLGSVTIAIGTSLHDAERALILATLERCGGVRKRTAALLGISLKTLYNRLMAYRTAPRSSERSFRGSVPDGGPSP